MNRVLLGISFLYCLIFIGLYPGWYDSAELVTGSFTLGLTHPPGQPFYILLNYAFCNLFMFGSIAFRSALFSCLLGIASVYLAYKLIIEDQKLNNFQKILIYISLLTIPSLAVQITRIELYTLILFLALLNIHCIHQFMKKDHLPYLYLAAFICGLAFCVHTLMAFFQTLILALYCLHILIKTYNKNTWQQLKKTAWLNIFFFIGFACNLYLVIRAHSNLKVMMMPIENFSDFMYFILAKTYARSFSLKSLHYNIDHFGSLLKIILPFVFFILPSLIFINFSKLVSKKTFLFLFFSLINTIPWLILPYTFENPDIHGYALILCFSILIFSWHILLQSQTTFTQWKTSYTSILASFLIIFQSYYFTSALKTNGSEVGKILSHFLKKTPYNSVSILTSDHWVFNYWYAQYIENIKPDHWTIPAELAKNKWYQKKHLSLFKNQYTTKVFEENETINDNELFLSSNYFSQEKEKLLNYCQAKLKYDFSSIEKTICTYTIVQWSKQFFRQQDLLAAINLLEEFYQFPLSQEACPYPEKNFQSPFLLDTHTPLFLPEPNHGIETLVYYYIQCNLLPKNTIDVILKMNPSLNTYLLLTQGVLKNSSSEQALEFLKSFKEKFRINPEQYQQAHQYLLHKIQ
ncbi:MAG TPA: DUF2723 domain-containing protein [Oligoflexia bacterium]|nr:DUF2723 domain-containing protein [Oligoflexia bacterium]HMR23760.1 DUF2723 domain-containing protein [Oligoflexia bacterium]